MASGLRSLPLLLFVTAACTQVIGLSSYEKTDADSSDTGGTVNEGGTRDPSDGGADDTGGTNDGGTGNRPNGGSTSGGSVNAGGDGGTPPAEGGAGSAGAPIVSAGAGGTEAGGTGGGDAGSGGAGGNDCVGVDQELLLDGAFDLFDNDLTPWLQFTTNEAEVLSDDEDPDDGGDGGIVLTQPRSAWLGGFAGESEDEFFASDLWQEVTIPASTVRLSARCQALVQSDLEDGGLHARMQFKLQDSDTYEDLLVLDTIDNNAAESVWFEIGRDVELAELEQLNILGRTVLIDLFSLNDEKDEANFFVDNCSVIATICP